MFLAASGFTTIPQSMAAVTFETLFEPLEVSISTTSATYEL